MIHEYYFFDNHKHKSKAKSSYDKEFFTSGHKREEKVGQKGESKDSGKILFCGRKRRKYYRKKLNRKNQQGLDNIKGDIGVV